MASSGLDCEENPSNDKPGIELLAIQPADSHLTD
jgi:hypothetical protein